MLELFFSIAKYLSFFGVLLAFYFAHDRMKKIDFLADLDERFLIVKNYTIAEQLYATDVIENFDRMRNMFDLTVDQTKYLLVIIAFLLALLLVNEGEKFFGYNVLKQVKKFVFVLYGLIVYLGRFLFQIFDRLVAQGM